MTMYDKKGRIRASGEDICDCFDADCPGCHFDCDNCGSPKCCVECRNLRKFCYDEIDLERNPGLGELPKTNPLSQETINNEKKKQSEKSPSKDR